MSVEWLRAMHGLKFRESDDALREIARLLRDGDHDPWSLSYLANYLDPDTKWALGNVKLVVKRMGGAGAPKRRLAYDKDLVDWLEHMIDVFNEKPDAVYARAKDRFKVGRSTCIKALNHARAERDEEFFERYRATMLRAKEAGVSDLPEW